MRMASALATLLAVLCSAAAHGGDMIGNVSRSRRAPQPHYSHRVLPDEENMMAAWKRSHWRDMQIILHEEGNQKDGVQKDGVQCCPSVVEMVTKKGGRTPTGLYVELYEDGENQQRLFEVSCAPKVVNNPCRFVDARLYNGSHCVQKYSYSYALVRYLNSATETPQPRTEGHFSVPGSGGWSMDYVRVRSGCECQIKPKNTKPSRRRHKQKKQKNERNNEREREREREKERESNGR